MDWDLCTLSDLLSRRLACRSVLAITLVGASAFAASGADARRAVERSTVAPPIVVTRDELSLPQGCAPRAVALFISRFFENVNRGSAKALRTRIAPAPTKRDVAADARDDGRLGFRWFSMISNGSNFVAYTKARLLRYFVARHRQQERLQLVMVDVTNGVGKNTVAVSVFATRTARDLAETADSLYFGKAEFNCQPIQIYVWSMSGPDDPPHWPCPLPSGWTIGDSVVACTRS